jgi:hypothetical protein
MNREPEWRREKSEDFSSLRIHDRDMGKPLSNSGSKMNHVVQILTLLCGTLHTH